MHKIEIDFTDPEIIKYVKECSIIGTIGKLKQCCVMMQLLVLLEPNGKKYGELAILTKGNPNTLTQNLDILTRAGLVTHVKGETKANEYYTITDLGRERLAKVSRLIIALKKYPEVLDLMISINELLIPLKLQHGH